MAQQQNWQNVVTNIAQMLWRLRYNKKLQDMYLQNALKRYQELATMDERQAELSQETKQKEALLKGLIDVTKGQAKGGAYPVETFRHTLHNINPEYMPGYTPSEDYPQKMNQGQLALTKLLLPKLFGGEGAKQVSPELLTTIMQAYGADTAREEVGGLEKVITGTKERALQGRGLDIEKYKADVSAQREDRLGKPPKSPEKAMSELEKADELLETYNKQIDILMKRKKNAGGEGLDKTETQMKKEAEIDKKIRHYEKNVETVLNQKIKLLQSDKLLKIANDLKQAGFKKNDILKNEELRKRIQAQGISPEQLLPYFEE